MSALGDVLLVLLGDAPGTAHDLQQRHAATFGVGETVDISRVVWALTRLERQALVRGVATSARARQRRFELTDEGAERRDAWLLRVPADATADDIRTRVLLAVETADRPTFEAVVAACRERLESRRAQDGGRPGTPLSAEGARAAFTDATLAAELGWLRDLSDRVRERDSPVHAGETQR